MPKSKHSESIISNDKVCYLTGSRINLERHHCMNGFGLRQKAEEDGLWVWLNHDVHMAAHTDHPEVLKYLKKVAQKAYEETHTRDEWMRRYHKNYLGDDNG